MRPVELWIEPDCLEVISKGLINIARASMNPPADSIGLRQSRD